MFLTGALFGMAVFYLHSINIRTVPLGDAAVSCILCRLLRIYVYTFMCNNRPRSVC